MTPSHISEAELETGYIKRRRGSACPTDASGMQLQMGFICMVLYVVAHVSVLHMMIKPRTHFVSGCTQSPNLVCLEVVQ